MSIELDYPIAALRETLGRLRRSDFVAGACAHLERHATEIETQLGTRILDEIPAFSTSKNPAVLPDLAAHAHEHVNEVLRLMAGGAVGAFDFVKEHGRRRAEQYFPLEATLHAYRCGHKVFAHWLRAAALEAVPSPEPARDAVAMMADFGLEYSDAISTIAAGAYLAQTRLMADVAGDLRARLMSVLLDGHDESDQRIARTLHDAGYLDRRQSFCVALAQPVDPAEMANPERARRLAESVETLLRLLPARRLVDVRDSRVAVIVSHDRRASGWTAPRASLARQVSEALSLAGNAVLIGVSNDVPSTASIPAAYREASVALELADMSHRVVDIASVPLRRVILHLAAEHLQRMLPAWAEEFFDADAKASGELSRTLRAYANANMNAIKAAQRLSVHPNTLYARLQKIRTLTGLEARSFHALADLLVVADCRKRADLAAQPGMQSVTLTRQ